MVNFSGRLTARGTLKGLGKQVITLYREEIDTPGSIVISNVPVAKVTTSASGEYSWHSNLSQPNKYFAQWQTGKAVTTSQEVRVWQQVVLNDPTFAPPLLTLEMEGSEGPRDRPALMRVAVTPLGAFDASLHDGQAQFRLHELKSGSWDSGVTISTQTGKLVGVGIHPFHSGLRTFRISFGGSDFYGYRPATSPAASILVVLTGTPVTFDDATIDDLYRQLAVAYCEGLGNLIAKYGSVGSAGNAEYSLVTRLMGDISSAACKNDPGAAVSLWKNFGNYLAGYIQDKAKDFIGEAALGKVLDNVINAIVDHMGTKAGVAASYVGEHIKNWLGSSLYQLVQSLSRWVTSTTVRYVNGAVIAVSDSMQAATR